MFSSPCISFFLIFKNVFIWFLVCMCVYVWFVCLFVWALLSGRMSSTFIF